MFRRWLLSWLLLPLPLVILGGLRGDEPAQLPKETPVQAQMDRLIRQLGSEKFSEREEASQQLKKIGPRAIPALRAVIKSKDAEVSRRAADIAVVIENTLEQLAIDYRALGLPFPPKDAKLVRVNGYNSGTVSVLSFQLKPASGNQGPILLEGSVELQLLQWIPTIQALDPKPEAVKDLNLGLDPVGLAIQCSDRGWHNLAEHILERAKKIDPDPPRLQLLHAAWNYWEGKLTQPKIDRAPIATRLKEVMARDEAMDTQGGRAFLKSLELALVPSKAKPGSIEALIDDLVDYGADTEKVGLFETDIRYLRIAERGFEAVPALIEHLDDERLTRGRQGGFNNFFGYPMQVKHVVSDLLEDLAGQEIDRDFVRKLQGYAVEKDAARKWWTEARKAGEKAYLLKRVLPPDGAEKGEQQIDAFHLQVIMARYPQELPALYRTVLDKRPKLDSEKLAQAVARSRLPIKDKLDLLLYGTKHKEVGHRYEALRALKDVSNKEFNALLLSTIEAYPDDVPGPYGFCAEAVIAGLVVESDDVRVWSALQKVAQRSAVGLRMELLRSFCDPKNASHREEQLRQLASFLDDTTIRDRNSSEKYNTESAGFPYKKLAVRDFAAMELAELLGIEVPVKPERTPDEWAKIRRQVREAAKRELGKTK